MLLILSEETDESTNDVMEWLQHFDIQFVRSNGNRLESRRAFALSSDHAFHDQALTVGPDPSCVSAIWMRRWRNPMLGGDIDILDRTKTHGEQASFFVNLSEFKARELRTLGMYFFRQYEKCRWLGDPATMSLNKLVVLSEAESAGFVVPPYLVTNSRGSVVEFLAKHGAIITKPIAEIAHLVLDNQSFLTYTTRCSPEFVSELPEYFFPAIFQKEVAKFCELRVFVLGGRIYPMAMFSQNRSQTSIDFRRYSSSDPTRCVPYLLPVEVETCIKNLMSRLNLQTGSIDLILTPNDEHVFLEVNPVGQFGMTSYPCNYHIERDIALYLGELSNG